MRALDRSLTSRLFSRRRPVPAGGRLARVLALVCAAGTLGAAEARAQGFFLFRAPQRPVAQAIPLQPAPVINQAVYNSLNPETSRVVVSLPKQRIYLLGPGNDVAIDAPVSSGRAGHTTPTGSFHILEKASEHFSNIYGNFIDRDGRVVRSGVSARIDSAPSGTHFEGAPMLWFMRLTDGGVGMHIGILPGYAASHGCVRLPSSVAPLIYQKVKVGTSVRVEG